MGITFPFQEVKARYQGSFHPRAPSVGIFGERYLENILLLPLSATHTARLVYEFFQRSPDPLLFSKIALLMTDSEISAFREIQKGAVTQVEPRSLARLPRPTVREGIPTISVGIPRIYEQPVETGSDWGLQFAREARRTMPVIPGEKEETDNQTLLLAGLGVLLFAI